MDIIELTKAFDEAQRILCERTAEIHKYDSERTEAIFAAKPGDMMHLLEANMRHGDMCYKELERLSNMRVNLGEAFCYIRFLNSIKTQAD